MKHNHYFKDCPYERVDVYRIIEIFGVTDPCIQHALKKLLCSGVRGHKDQEKDIQDVIDTLERWKQMRNEDAEATSSGELSPKADLPKVSKADADIDNPVKPWLPDISGKWVEYDGSGQPVEGDVEVEVLFFEERNSKDYTPFCEYAKYLCWEKEEVDSDIVAYRVVE